MPSWIVNNCDGDLLSVDMAAVDIVLFCVPRSGSTVVHEILMQMFPEAGILRTHQFIPPPPLSVVVCCYRRVLDCIASHYRYRCRQDAPMSRDVARVFAGRYTEYWRTLFLYQRWARKSGRAFCRMVYEEHRGKPQVIYEQIQIDLPLRGRKLSLEVLKQYDIEHMRVRADASESPLMQPGHVGSGEVGSYKQYMTAEAVEEIDTLFSEYILP